MKIRSILLTSTLVAASAGSLAFAQTDQAQQPLPKEGAQVLIVGADSVDTHRNEYKSNHSEDDDDVDGDDDDDDGHDSDDHDDDDDDQDDDDQDSDDDGSDND